MRRGFLSLSIGASSVLLVGALTAGGCSSSSATQTATDGAPPTHAGLGEPCSASFPCEPVTDVCSASVCDPTSHLCVRIAVDAGPICTGGTGPTPTCASASCDGGAEEAGDAEAGTTDGGDAGDGSVDAADGATDAGLEGGTDATGDAAEEASSVSDSDAGGD